MLLQRNAVALDHFVKREGLDPVTIKMKSVANLHNLRAEAEGDEIYYALPQLRICCAY